MSKENYQWLAKELPSWVSEKLVTQESAEALLHRYAGEKSSQRSSGIAFSLLGFALVGLGIISILAYNWDELGHLERTLLAITLLVGAQLFAFWVKRYKPNDTALLESSGVLWFLMMGASLAIIGQTYHLGGTLADFLSVWLLLSFGIAWLLPSSGAAFFQIILWSVVWLGSRSDVGALLTLSTHSFLSPWMLALLALSWLGFYVVHHQRAKNANATLLLSWAIALCVFVIFIVEVVIETYHLQNVRLTLTAFALFFAIYYLAGKLYLSQGEKSWQRPFERIGKVGALLLLLAHVSLNAEAWLIHFSSLRATSNNSLLVMVLALMFTALLALFIRKEKRLPSEALVLASPIILFIYGLLENAQYTAMLFINLLVVLGASWMIFCGAKEEKIGLINQGMLLIALVIWIHFMDANFDLVAKGMAFIVTGVLFLSLNALIRRRFKGVS